jgi:P27 family predicted phage terminase small subunit
VSDTPDWLSPAARDVFERTSAELAERGRTPDRDTLAVYAHAVVQHSEAVQLVDRSAMLVRGADDRLMRNPASAVVRDAAATVTRLARQLGLSEPEHKPTRRRGRRNSEAIQSTIATLRHTGRLEKADDATVALARTLAQALDTVDPETQPAQLASIARAQLATIKLLRGVADDGDSGSGGLDELLAALGDPAEP